MHDLALRRESTGEAPPLWGQLKHALRDQILTELSPGDRIPSEEELGRRYGVSRITVRHAIGSLAAEGWLISRQGQGTFVARNRSENAPSPELDAFLDVLALIHHVGRVVSVSVSTIEEVPADARTRLELKASARDELHKFRREFAVDGEVIMHEVVYAPKRLFPDLPSQDLHRESIRDLILAQYGLSLESVDVSIRAVSTDGFRAQLLGVNPGDPELLIESVANANPNRPFLFTRQFLPHDRIAFRARIVPSPQAASAKRRRPGRIRSIAPALPRSPSRKA
jgi:GntR family transcriptional regulator